MKKYLKQFRYQGKLADKDSDSLVSGFFSYKKDAISIASLGIQTLPGIKFYLNNSQVDPIIVGPSGIYELGIDENYEITGIQFDRETLDNLMNNNNGAYLIIDIVYNVEE